MHYIIGTRGSKLALTQTNYVKSCLEKAYPEDSFEIKIIKTIGDTNQLQALDQLGAKGVFTSEIEEQLLSGEIQMAVHSMKDMPEEVAEGLAFVKSWKREDPRDVLILRNAKSLEELPEGAVIGTGSKRRAYQLKKLRPDIKTIGIRGNVDTRIRKLMEPGIDAAGNPEPEMDGIVLAAAGMKRLGRENEITCYLSPDQMIPAPAQGILALEVRADDVAIQEKLNALADEKTILATELERGFLKAIGGDCHLPIGAYYEPKNNMFYGIFGSEDGSKLAQAKVNCGCIKQGSDEIAQIINAMVCEINAQLKG